jgi:hypothetical protein
MPLYPISSQPYFLDPNAPKREDCPGEYYYPVIPSDEIYWQGYQTPCGINIAEDPNFENFSVGAELLTNGSFTGSLTGWSTSGTWAYGTNNAVYTGSVGGGDLSQGIAISIGDTVQIEFEVSGIFNGSPMQVYLGTSLVAEITDVGAYSFTGIYGAGSAELIFTVPVNGGIGSIALDNVSAKVYSQTDWDGNNEWNFLDGFACHSVAGTGDLTNIASNYVTSGNRYRITFTLTGNTLGSITPKAGGTGSAAQSGNGIKTVWINAGGNGVVAFTPTSDFTGCISELDVREMKVASDFTWQIISELGDGDVYDMESYVVLYEDFLTLIYDPQDDQLPSGCYIIRIYDTCTVQYEDVVINGTFFGGSGASCPDWFLNNGAAQYDFGGNDAEFIYTGTGGPFEVTNPSIFNTVNPLTVDGNYQVTFDIISNTDTTNIGVNVRPRGAALPAFYSTVGTHTYTVNNYAPADDVLRAIVCLANFSLLGVDTPGSIVIDNVQVIRIAPFEATYTSENIDYHPGHENTSLIRAYNDQNSFGFEFENSGYYIQQRMVIRSMNEFERSESQIALSGNGSGRLYYAEAEFYWIIATDYMDASAHKALSIQIKCNHLLMGYVPAVFKEYLPTTDEYRVDWRPSGDYNLATSQFAVRIKDGGQIFNREI